MGIAEDLQILDKKLKELIILYDQYFMGIERREPIKLLAEVENLVRRYAGTPINNTMHKYRYNNLVARLGTYRQQWTRILREIEEGRYFKDRFRAKLHETAQNTDKKSKPDGEPVHSASRDMELERLFSELESASARCNTGKAAMTREQLAATIDKQRPVLVQKLGSDDIIFRVVVEDGKPKIKAGLKPKTPSSQTPS